MGETRGGQAVLVAGTLVALLTAGVTLLALLGPSSAPTPPIEQAAGVSADGAVDSSTGEESRARPRRNRVSVLHGAQREAADAAERGLSDLAVAREALRAAKPPDPDPDPDRADARGLVLVDSKHLDGREFRRGWQRDGARDGLWTETFESGARIETFYRAGLRHGREAAWHPDGKPRFLGEYTEDEMSGTWTAWHSNGNILSTRQYLAGRLQGWMRTFHESGILAEESEFDGGLETGLNRGWHESGYLAWEIPYVDGEKDGPAVWYDDSGVLLAKGSYVAGALHGPYVEYAPDGTVKRTERWENGHRVALTD